MRSMLYSQELDTYYQKLLENKNAELDANLQQVADDDDFRSIFQDVKMNGEDTMRWYLKDEDFLEKVSEKCGGLPRDVREKINRIRDEPVTLWEAAKMGHERKVQEAIDGRRALDIPDLQGVTPIGYAVACGHVGIVKSLVKGRANIHEVDSKENSTLHYAAGYGHGDLVQYLLDLDADPTQPNIDGHTPYDVARINHHTSTIELLEGKS